jgi:hypothetical protein
MDFFKIKNLIDLLTRFPKKIEAINFSNIQFLSGKQLTITTSHRDHFREIKKQFSGSFFCIDHEENNCKTTIFLFSIIDEQQEEF